METEYKQRVMAFLTRRLKEEGTINAMMDMQLIAYDCKKRSVLLRFPIKAWQLNPAKNLHGGIICTALDISMGCAAYVYSKASFTPTIQMSVNFVKGIPCEKCLIIEAICDHSGSRMAQIRAIAHMEDSEEVVASANGSYAINTK